MGWQDEETAGEETDEEGLAGYYETYEATEPILQRAKHSGIFDHARIAGEIPDGEPIDPGVEVRVSKDNYVADLIRHKEPHEGGFNYKSNRVSRILHITVCKKIKGGEFEDLGTYEWDNKVDPLPEFMKRAEKDVPLRRFLRDISSHLS